MDYNGFQEKTMCFSVALTRETIENDPRFSHLLDDLYHNPGFRISGFSFPGLPILRDGFSEKAVPAGWGLIPGWVKDPQQGKTIRKGTLNARWESAGVKPSFRDSWPGKRCILPVDAFYEPHLEGGRKSSWIIRRRDGKLLYLGGIYQLNRLGNGMPSLTFSILTLGATGLLAEVHNEKLRMPLVLGEGQEERWLDGNGPPPEPEDSSWLIDQSLLDAGEDGEKEKKEPVQGMLF